MDYEASMRRHFWGSIAVLIFAAILALVPIYHATEIVALKKLRSNGVSTVGHVEKAWVSTLRQATQYRVSYTFVTPDGKTWTGPDTYGSLAEPSWEKARTEKVVPIRYLPQDPSRNRCEEDVGGGITLAWIMIAFFAPLVVFVVAMGIWGIRWSRS